MFNFVGQTSRLVVVHFGRFHHAAAAAASSNANGAATGLPATASVTVRHQYQRRCECTAADKKLLPMSALAQDCRVPCIPPEQCSTRTCHRFFGTSCSVNALTRSSSILPEDKPGLLTRMMDSVGISGKLRFNRFKVRVAGLNMYQACADGYNFETFFRACNMPDTLFSWFLIMELHVWMCMVRLKQEGREGKYMTHYLILSMWHDVQERGKLMGISAVKMKESLSKMVEQFNGALFAYDEGLLSNDKVLAAALWRNLFLRNCDDPERLEGMVEYVRQQIQYLDSLDSSKLLQVGRIKWQPFKGRVPSSDLPLPKAASVDDELNIPEVDKVPV